MKLLKQKWNIKQLNIELIARLLSEIEGCCYILDCIDSEDYESLSSLRKKYYKLYFELEKKNK
jgi:hypothetical protein